jgi:hypothetical protein
MSVAYFTKRRRVIKRVIKNKKKSENLKSRRSHGSGGTWIREKIGGEKQFWEAAQLIFLCQLLNTATSLPADDVHHYVIPPKFTLDQ